MNRNTFKFVLALALTVGGANAGWGEGLSGATIKPATAASSGTRQDCQGEPAQCREQARQRWQERCKENPQQCEQAKARAAERREQCRADPEKCREQARAHLRQRFGKADADGSGGLSRTEAEKGMPAVARRFDAIDTDKDGRVTLDEIEAAYRQRRAPEGRRETPASGQD